MTPDEPERLERHRLVAAVLRYGTITSVGGLAVGLAWTAATGSVPPAHSSVVDLIGRGAPAALIGAGLLALTLVPPAALAASAVAFARAGERRSLIAALAVLGLLAASFAVAVIVGLGA